MPWSAISTGIGELGCLRTHLPCGLACFTVYAQASCPPTSSSGQLGNVYLPSSSAMCLSRRSPITWSPGFTSGDFIFNPVTAGSGVLEIGARQLINWRLHEPPDFLPFCQQGVPSTRLYNSLMPRHHFRLPGRYNFYSFLQKKYFIFYLCGLVSQLALGRCWPTRAASYAGGPKRVSGLD